MWEFFEEYDGKLYKKIINDIEPNKNRNVLISEIEIFFQMALKKVWIDEVVIIYRVEKGRINKDRNPSLQSLLAREEVDNFFNENVSFSLDALRKFLNSKAGGEKQDYNSTQEVQNEADIKNIESSEEKCLIGYKYLFEYCKAIYEYTLEKSCPIEWTDEYFYNENDESKQQIVELKNGLTTEDMSYIETAIPSSLNEAADKNEAIAEKTVDKSIKHKKLVNFLSIAIKIQCHIIFLSFSIILYLWIVLLIEGSQIAALIFAVLLLCSDLLVFILGLIFNREEIRGFEVLMVIGIIESIILTIVAAACL